MNTAAIDVDSPITSSSANYLKNPFTFTGREYDTETGNYYFRARYLSTDGRYLSKDPIGFAGLDTNLYRYVFNNPLNYVDPTGEIFRILSSLALFTVIFETTKFFTDKDNKSNLDQAATDLATKTAAGFSGKAGGIPIKILADPQTLDTLIKVKKRNERLEKEIKELTEDPYCPRNGANKNK